MLASRQRWLGQIASSTSPPPHELDEASARQIPAAMLGWLLDDGDLRKLERMILRKKPPAPSVRHRTAEHVLR